MTPELLDPANSRVGLGPLTDEDCSAVVPRTARALIDALGPSGAATFFAEFRCQRVFVPAAMPGADHRLHAVLGLELTERIVQRFGGAPLYVPIFSRVDQLMRNGQILRDREAGMPIRALVLKYRMTERHLRKILGKAAIAAANGAVQRPIAAARRV